MGEVDPDDGGRAPVVWRVLGGVGVDVGGVPVALGPRLRFVLGCLLIEPGRPVPAGALAGIEWDGATPAATAGRVALRRLRVALASAGVQDAVTTTPHGYALDVDPHTVDHIEFERRCRAVDTELWSDKAWRHADRARRAWTGRPFGELADHEAFRPRTLQLEELHRLLLDHWGELALQAGSHGSMAAVLVDDVAAEPLRERRWGNLALARYRAGDQAGALRTLADARAELAESVGLEPGPGLQVLEQRILTHDPQLRWRPTHALGAGVGRLGAGPVVVGRGPEVDDVIDLLERHRVVVLEGPGGMGKSTVAAEVCRQVARPSVWVDLTTVGAPGLVIPAVASAMELSAWMASSGGADAVADQLQRSAALLVLDNADDRGLIVADAVAALVARAPSLRVVITSRSPVPLATAIVRPIGPLATGTPDDPGPAALLAADFAGISRSQMTTQWSTVESLCERSGGVPLAIRLLAAGGPPEPMAGIGGDLAPAEVVGAAARTAIERLPSGAVELVTTIADLPAGATVPLLARVLAVPEAELHRHVGAALRAGVMVEAASGSRLRVRVLDPVVDVLRPFGPDPATSDWLATRVADAAIEAVALAQPSLIGRVDLAQFAVLDDDHDTLLWALGRLGPLEQLRLANRLATVWKACGRNVQGLAILRGLEATAATASPLERARYWVMRAQISPEFAGRAGLIDELQTARRDAERLGHLDLEIRIATELAIGLAWSGQPAEAMALLDKSEARIALDDFGKLTLRSLRDLGRALAGDIGGAIDDLLLTADAFEEVGLVAEAVGTVHVALSAAVLSDDARRAARILERATGIVPDRFTGYATAAMTYRRAQLLWQREDPAAGPLLAEAHVALRRHGEGQWAPACLADLGWWRATHGDPGGRVDLAAASIDLLRLWTAAAARSLARLAVLLAEAGHPDDARLIAAAAIAPRPEVGLPIPPAEHRIVIEAARDLEAAQVIPPADEELVALLRCVAAG